MKRMSFEYMKPLALALSLLLMFSAGFSKPWPEVTIQPFAGVPEAVTVPQLRPVKEAELGLEGARAGADLLKNMEITLSPSQKTTLNRDKFLLIPMESVPSLDPMEREPYEPEPDQAAFYPKPTGGLAVYEDEMFSLYGRIGGGGEIEPWRNHFVTADVMLHAWHRFFENAMEEIETTVLHARLDAFLTQWLSSIRVHKQSSSPELLAHWEQIEAQIAVASVILGDDGEEPRGSASTGAWDDSGKTVPLVISTINERIASEIKSLPKQGRGQAEDEIRLILGKEGIFPSPLFASYDLNQGQDYTQFTPRSHYAKNYVLRGYFRAMMYLGRNGWPLKAPDDGGSAPGLSHALLLGLSLTSPSAEGVAPIEAWRDIFEMTSFFAGASDDIDYPEFRRWVGGNVDLETLTPAKSIDPETLKSLGEKLDQLKKPGVLSQARSRAKRDEIGEEVRDESLQFRVFGQRFTYDAWVFTELTPPLMKQLPGTPTALFVAAALGDPVAQDLSLKWLETSAPAARADFEGKMEMIRETLSTVPDGEWFASMASKQLHLIGTLSGPRGDGFPTFMRSPQWGAKQVETMLGSFTQLKHDTLLYAKQNYAEMGEGGLGEEINEDDVPYGYVQPDVRFWAELERLVNFTYEGFTQHKLLPNVVEEFGHLGRFKGDVSALRLLANKSAAAESWTLEDRLWLLEFNPAYMSDPINPMNIKGPDDGKTAIVADIQTNVEEGKVLYQGLGRPYLILALVGDAGMNRLVAGTAYDYYEFTLPLQERLGDEEWRKKFYSLKPEPQTKPNWAPVPVR